MFIFHRLSFPGLFILMSLNIISKLMTPKLDYQLRTLSLELQTHIFNCLLNISQCLVDIKNLTYLNWNFWSHPLPIPGNAHTILPFLRPRLEPSLVPLFCPVPEQSFTRSRRLLLYEASRIQTLLNPPSQPSWSKQPSFNTCVRATASTLISWLHNVQQSALLLITSLTSIPTGLFAVLIRVP